MRNGMLGTDLSFVVKMVSLQYARASQLDLNLHTTMMTHTHSNWLLVTHWLLINRLLDRLLVHWLLISHRLLISYWLLITHWLLLDEAELLLTYRLLHWHATHTDNDRWLMMTYWNLGRDSEPVKEDVRVAFDVFHCNLVSFATSVEVEPVMRDVFLTNSSSVVLAFYVFMFDQLVMINIDVDFALSLFPASKHLSCQKHLIVVRLDAKGKCKLQMELRLM